MTVHESIEWGTNTVTFSNNSSGNNILSKCKELFFPKDISKFGKLYNMGC